jgi:hypothetical protein
MAIKDFYVQGRNISFGTGDFTVTGISFDHLVKLFTESRDEMEEAMGMYEGLAMSGEVQTETLIAALLEKLPDLVAKIICIAAGEPGAEAQVRAMPFAVQMDALMAVSELTFVEADSLKKFLGHLTGLVKGLTSLTPPAATVAAIGG